MSFEFFITCGNRLHSFCNTIDCHLEIPVVIQECAPATGLVSYLGQIMLGGL